MTQKKQQKKDDKHFAHTPFKELKGLVPREQAPPGPLRDRPADPDPDVDDTDLFLRAVGTVNRRNQRPPDSIKNAPQRRSTSTDEEQDRALFLASLERAPSDRPQGAAEDAARVTRSPAGKMKLLRRGVIRIDGELDLHGLVAEDALTRLAHFLENAGRRGARAVLVITGKGLNSPNGPVLPGAVVTWLKGPGKRIVSEFAPAPRDKGGSGAIVVFLKR